MNHLILLADIVASRSIQDRDRFQAKLESKISEINQEFNAILKVPVTITLGDEFQAIFSSSQNLFLLLHSIELAFPATRFRFVLSFGSLVTPINPLSAIGMDGPVFHHARDTMIEAKKENRHFCFAGEDAEFALVDQLLAWIDTEISRWKQERLQVLYWHRLGLRQKEIEKKIGISQAAISQNLNTPAFKQLLESELRVEYFLTQKLQGQG